MRERIIAILRLGVAFAFIWFSVSEASGISLLNVAELLKYTFTHIEVVGAYFATAYGWWKNENMSNEAQALQPTLIEWKKNRNKVGGEV